MAAQEVGKGSKSMTLTHKANGLGSILNNLNRNGQNLSKTLARLSSGQNINASASATQLASTLRSDARQRGAALGNVNSAITVVNKAEQGLNALSEILSELEKRVLQANQAVSHERKQFIHYEAAALVTECNRIVNETSIQGFDIFAAEQGSIGVHTGGTGAAQDISFVLGNELERSVSDMSLAKTALYSDAISELEVEFGDLNGDGNLDLVSLSAFEKPYVHSGNGDGTFSSSGEVLTGLTSTDTMDLANVNDDSNLDLVIGSNDGYLGYSQGNGDLTFDTNVLSLVEVDNSAITNLQLADVTGDGNLDAVYVSDGLVKVAEGDGLGNFAEGVAISGIIASDFELGDLNDDGHTDIVSFGPGAFDPLTVYLNDTSGNFTATVSAPFGLVITDVAIGDLAQDGYDDIVLSFSTGYLFAGLSDGSGSFISTSLIAGLGTEVEIADVNSDGFLDVVGLYQDTLTVTINEPGSLEAVTLGTVADKFSRDFQMVDLNNDGVPDFGAAQTLGSGVSLAWQATEQSTAIAYLNLYDDADTNLATLSETSSRVESELNKVKALQSRFESTLRDLQKSKSNLEYGAERSLSIDQASELANYIKNSAFQNERLAILAQANLSEDRVLSLLA